MIRWNYNSPTKFGGGVGLQWRGMNQPTLSRAIWRVFSTLPNIRSELDLDRFLFESARSALFHVLTAMGVGKGHEVIVSAFTCEAVTYAVMKTGATVVYVDINDDLTMNEFALRAALTGSTRAVVMQNTFGRLGLTSNVVEWVKAKGVLVIEDCALSIGSRLGDTSHGDIGDFSTWSLEASKTITLGWGGVLKVNDPARLRVIEKYYFGLKRVPFWLDFIRVLQLWVSVRFSICPPPLGLYLWYFLYGLKFFRRSSDSQKSYFVRHSKMGVLTSLIYNDVSVYSDDIFKKTNNNYTIIAAKAQELGLNCPVVPRHNEFIVSPRFSLLVGVGERQFLTQSALKLGIELGCWFEMAPPPYRLDQARVSSSTVAKNISDVIVNLPCHWTLSSADLKLILKWMESIPGDRSAVIAASLSK